MASPGKRRRKKEGEPEPALVEEQPAETPAATPEPKTTPKKKSTPKKRKGWL